MRILFCGEGFAEARKRLAVLLPDDEILAYPSDEHAAHIAKADVVVPLVACIDEIFIRKGTFGLIRQYGVGLEGVDIEAATRNGVRVARIPSEESGNTASVAEHAILLILMLSRHWNEITRSRQRGEQVLWGSPVGQALRGKTVCIIGLGGVGRELTRRLGSFQVRISTVEDHPGRAGRFRAWKSPTLIPWQNWKGRLLKQTTLCSASTIPPISSTCSARNRSPL